MKKTYLIGLVVMMVYFAFSKDINFEIKENELLILDDSGKEVMGVGAGALNKEIKIGDIDFDISFGYDALGKCMVVVSPIDGKIIPYNIIVLGKKIESDGKALIQFYFSKDMKSVDISADLGQVKVMDVITNQEVKLIEKPLLDKNSIPNPIQVFRPALTDPGTI